MLDKYSVITIDKHCLNKKTNFKINYKYTKNIHYYFKLNFY